MAAALSLFYPELRLEFAGAPLPVLDEAVRRGAIRAAHLSGFVRETRPLSIVATTRTYALTASDAQHEVDEVIYVKPADRDELDAREPDALMLEGAETGTPRCQGLVNQTLYLYPVPTENESANVRIAVKPKRTATSLMDVFSGDEDLYQATLAGAKHWLAKQIGQPWSQAPEVVAMLNEDFLRHVDELKKRALIGDSRVEMHVAPSAFGGVSPSSTNGFVFNVT